MSEPYRAAETDFVWWICGADRRRVVDGAWEVASAGSPIEAARAGTACLHEALDHDELDLDAVRRLVPEIDAWQ